MTTRTAFILPGQGSQKLGMLDLIPENDTFVRLLDAAEALSGLDLRVLAAAGEPDELADTRVAQPLLYLADWAWGIALMDCRVVPDVLAGHSLGELAALALAGVYSVEAGLELVVERSRLMAMTAANTPGGMSAVLGLPAAAILEAIDGLEGVWVANDNSAGQVVISGTESGIEAATAKLTEVGARRIIPLKVAGPFHSPLMEPARAAFEDIVRQAEFNNASIPVVQNTSPTPVTDAELIRERLMTQITSPVRWTETLSTLVADGPIVLIESGPGTVLRGLARGIEGITAVSVEDTPLQTIAEEVVA